MRRRGSAGTDWRTLAAAAIIAAGGACDRGGEEPGRAPPEDASLLLARAEELAGKDLFVEAANLLRAGAPLAQPADRGRLLLRAAAHYHRGNVPPLALRCAEEAASLGASGPEASYIAADARRILCDPDARRSLDKLVLEHPDHAPGRLSLARLLFRAEDPVAALPHFEAYFARASPADPEHDEALAEEGRALRAAGRHEEALDRFVRLLEKDPLVSGLYSELATTLYRMKRRDEARFIERIYRLISQDAFEEHVEERLYETGSTAFALGQRAINRARQRRFLDAFRSHEAACRASPADARLRIHHADLCLRFLRNRDARETVEAGIRAGARPRSGLLFTLGRVHLAGEREADALRALDDASKALAGEGDLGGPERGQASAAEIARAREAGKSEPPEPIRARVRELEKAIDAEPLDSSGPRYLALGKLYLEVRDPFAFDLLLLAADLLPRSPEALVLVLSGMTRPEDVFVRVKYLRRLLEIQPGNDTAVAALLEIYEKLRLRPAEAARLAEGLRALRAGGSPPGGVPAPVAPGAPK